MFLKSTILALSMGVLCNVQADEKPLDKFKRSMEVMCDVKAKEERFNKLTFSLGHFGFEHSGKNEVYCAAEAKLAPTMNMDSKKKAKQDFFKNAETRIGYNLGVCQDFSVTAYGGMGYTHCRLEGEQFTLKEFPYITFGVKPVYSFGNTFSMGVNVRALKPIMMRHEMQNASPVRSIVKTATDFGITYGLPCIWNLGDSGRWDLTFEPYYTKLKGIDNFDLMGSTATFGYKF
jgi:hypothetical protein